MRPACVRQARHRPPMPTYLCAETVFVMFAVAGWIWPAPVSRFIILVTGMLFYRSRNIRLTGSC